MSSIVMGVIGKLTKAPPRFDQHTLKARVEMSVTIDDTIVSQDQRPWVPLQDILAGYVEMIDLGKVIVENPEEDPEEDYSSDRWEPQYQRKNRPWLVNPHSQVILNRTVTAFGTLLKAIEERMPRSMTGTASANPDKERVFDLAQVADKLVESKQVSGNNFVVKFLRAINNSVTSAAPRLRYIAPGLHIPGDHLMNQLFEGIDYHKSRNNNPILLFQGEWSDGTAPLTTFPGHVWNPFPSPYKRPVSGFRSGLWITENEFNSPAFDDACRMLLPDRFLEASQHHAKSTDGFLLEQPSDQGEGLSAGLFQTSCNVFMVRHQVQLFRVLEHWVGLVEDGTWTVDEHGVADGMEKWAEADQSDDMAEKYRLPYVW